MKQALLDSDTLSYFFKGNPKVIHKIDEYLIVYGFVHISVITFYEIQNGLLFKDARAQLQRFEQFVQLNQVLPVNLGVAERAAKNLCRIEKEQSNYRAQRCTHRRNRSGK